MCFLNIDSGFWLVLGNARAVAGQWALGRAGILESGLDDGSGSSTLVQVAMLLVRCGWRGTVLLCGVRRARRLRASADNKRQQKPAVHFVFNLTGPEKPYTEPACLYSSDW